MRRGRTRGNEIESESRNESDVGEIASESCEKGFKEGKMGKVEFVDGLVCGHIARRAITSCRITLLVVLVHV